LFRMVKKVIQRESLNKPKTRSACVCERES
jgi:hypothetical protein